MTTQHDIMKMYRRKECLPVCILSWERYRSGLQDTLCVRVQNEWVDFKPPTTRADIQQYPFWSHTYSPEAMQYYFELKELKKGKTE